MADFGAGLVDQVRLSQGASPRTGSIIRHIWHHQAGVDDDAVLNAMGAGASPRVSANYTVSNDDPGGRGWSRITGVVPERLRAWTSNSSAADGRALTCEVANSSGPPGYGIADASHEACARIAAYEHIAYGVPLQRATAANGWAGHMGHNEVYDAFGPPAYRTECPMNLDIDRIVARAAVLVGSGIDGGALRPAPDTATEDDDVTITLEIPPGQSRHILLPSGTVDTVRMGFTGPLANRQCAISAHKALVDGQRNLGPEGSQTTVIHAGAVPTYQLEPSDVLLYVANDVNVWSAGNPEGDLPGGLLVTIYRAPKQ